LLLAVVWEKKEKRKRKDTCIDMKFFREKKAVLDSTRMMQMILVYRLSLIVEHYLFSVLIRTYTPSSQAP
jgi:hypothetical protein